MEKFKYDETTGAIVGYTLEGAVHGIGDILNVKVDYSKSLFNPRVSKVVTDKGVIKNLRWCQTLGKLVEMGGGVLSEGNSISRVGGNRGKYIVKIVPLGVTTQHTTSKEEPEVVVGLPEIIKSKEAQQETKEELYFSPKLPDFLYAESLYKEDEEKESRKKLDLYAEGFGIKLNGRKKFSNMMEDFKSECK